ncbi:hypothetical protein BKA63DRAFT_77538 [Paraphoma chrysanthemicola]|nr:hypothetical protein BKA63DRAFT_77538 [Paraphoma chrysanthemicola]
MVVGQALCWASGQIPQAQLPKPRPFVRSTKLYVALTTLSCFVDRTVSYELRLHGLPVPVHQDFASSQSSEGHHRDASQKSARSDSTSDTTSAHVESMINGMAQDIFHHPTEQNFYESNWQAEFASWALDPIVQERYRSNVTAASATTPATTFVTAKREEDSTRPCQTAYFPGGNPEYALVCNGHVKAPSTTTVWTSSSTISQSPRPQPLTRSCDIAYFPGGNPEYMEICHTPEPPASTDWPHTREPKPTPQHNDGVKVSSKVDLFGFYALDVLGWKGMKCNSGIGGCENMPPPEFIRSRFPLDPHRARSVTYTINSFRKIYVELQGFQDVLQRARDQVEGYCNNFALTFFHKDTEPEKEMCAAQIIQIIMGIITAIAAILTLGTAMFAETPALFFVPAIVGTISGVGIGISGLETMSGSGAMNSVESVAEAAGATVVRESLSGDKVIVSAADARDHAAAYGFELVGGIAAGSENLDTMSGACSGVVGVTAMTDTAFAYFDGPYNWTAQLSALSDQELKTKIGTFDQIFREVAQRLSKVMFNITEYGRTDRGMPAWSEMEVTAAKLLDTLQVSALKTRNLIGLPKHIWFVETSRRALAKKIPMWATAATKDKTATKKVSPKIGLWMQSTMEDAILTAYGQALEVEDLALLRKEQKISYENRHAALKETFLTSMSSLVRQQNDKSPLPKEWGSFSLLEWFPIRDLSFDPSGQTPLYKQVPVQSRTFFRKFPELTSTTNWERHGQPSFMKHGTFDLNSDPDQNTALRMTKLFTLFELEDPRNAATLSVNSMSSLGTRISLRMQHENGQALTASEAWKFWDDYSDEIHRRVQMLRFHGYRNDSSSVARFVPLKAPKTLLNVVAQTSYDTMSWASVLGTIHFEGYTSNGAARSDVPELRWRTKPSTSMHAHLGKREAHKIMDSVAVHDIRGKLNTLESLGLINTRRGKKAKRDLPFYARETESGQIFVAEVNEQMFQSGIEQKACGTQFFRTDPIESERGCRSYIRNVVDQIDSQFEAKTRLEGDSIGSSALNIGKRFTTYEAFIAAEDRFVKTEDLQRKVKDNLKNSLVTKAYADQNCYLKCEPGDSASSSRQKVYNHNGKKIKCTTGCFDPITRNLDPLYGFDRGAGESPWSLSEAKINDVSWDAYQRHDWTGFIPGRVDLNPFVDHIKEHTPILPVCYSEFGLNPEDNGLLCNCGDKYGNETELVINAAHWVARGYKQEHEQFGKCIERLKPWANHPAAFLINMCNAYYKQLVPPGRGTYSEARNKGAYKQNLEMCKVIWTDYEAMKNDSEGTLDRIVCKRWRDMSKSHHADGGHADFSWVNSVVRKAGLCGKPGKKHGGKKNQ